MLRAAAKNHERVAVVVDPAQYGALAQSLAEGGTTLAQRRAFAAAAYAHTARYDGQVSGWLSVRAADPAQPEAWPAQLTSGAAPGRLAALRREPAPARRAVHRRPRRARHRRHRALPAGQGAELQQPRRRRCRAGMRARLRRPGLRDRQARQSLRRRPRRRSVRGLRARLRGRPDLGLRRHHRLQSPARRRAPPPRSSGASSWKWCWRRPWPPMRCRCSRRRRTCACWPVGELDAAPRPGYEMKRIAGGLLVQDADSDALTAADLRVVTQARADAGAARRPAVRLEGGDVREVERHRLCARRPDHRHRRRADERVVSRRSPASRPRKPAWTCPAR